MNTRLFAYFLPQFHNCPLNSKWWGEGFTEWDNVRKARPQFEGHHQPRVPAEGEYDLAVAEEISHQYDDARAHGVSSFAIYHYWSEGARPLKAPLDLILSRPDIDVKFSLCWANHPWTRKWSNRRGALDVLIDQTYEDSPSDRSDHFDLLSRAFSDERYTKVDGRPFFQIYMPEDIPNPGEFCDSLRLYCTKHIGVEPHISACLQRAMPNLDYLQQFDSVTLIQPTLALLSPLDVLGKSVKLGPRNRLADLPVPILRILYAAQDRFLSGKLRIDDYDEVWNRLETQTANALSYDKPIIPAAFVDFDNTPRYGGAARIMSGFSPDSFRSHLEHLVALASKSPPNIVMLNAWNEWGEGMYLQGDQLYPTERLKAVKAVADSL